MLVRPMIDSWEPSHIETITSVEARRMVALPVAGLSGDLHQDLGRGALAIEIRGSLLGDEIRDEFLKEVREKFLAGDPLDFVADIVGESELEQVVIDEMHFEESAELADAFTYRIVLREYTEPPEPPGPEMDLGAELDMELDLEADLGLDLFDLPAIVADIPDVGDLLSPVKTAAEELESALTDSASTLLSPLDDLFGGG
ncbi:MAG: hypothetical protein GY854_23165 [Deltaproteobacteria bacterium]|nr:hypothetical protein [Deltaproteobacteria bacterium]